MIKNDKMIEEQDYEINYKNIPKERLSLSIILILFLMHDTLTFPEIVLASGISPEQVLICLENLQRLRFIDVKKISEKEVQYFLMNKENAFKYLEELKIIQKK